jgi:hypothetical protein
MGKQARLKRIRRELKEAVREYRITVDEANAGYREAKGRTEHTGVMPFIPDSWRNGMYNMAERGRAKKRCANARDEWRAKWVLENS